VRGLGYCLEKFSQPTPVENQEAGTS